MKLRVSPWVCPLLSVYPKIERRTVNTTWQMERSRGLKTLHWTSLFFVLFFNKFCFTEIDWAVQRINCRICYHESWQGWPRHSPLSGQSSSKILWHVIHSPGSKDSEGEREPHRPTTGQAQSIAGPAAWIRERPQTSSSLSYFTVDGVNVGDLMWTNTGSFVSECPGRNSVFQSPDFEESF